MSGGVVIFAIPGVEDHRAAFETLYAEHGIAGASAGGGFSGIRLCPHLYNTLDQVDRAVEAVAALT
jgi:selenocysteine lyase/cysteine desulfurase